MISLISSSLAVLLMSGHVLSSAFTNLQPGINPVPSLPRNFSKKPDYWKHGTSLLQSPKIPTYPKGVQKRADSVWPGWRGISYIFSFGDSYTSTNFSISGEQPNPSNPLGNPAYPGLTSADGPNYIDFLTSTYNQSFIETYNFGYGGAVINDSIIHNGFGPTVQNFEDQVKKEFLPTYVNAGVPWTSSNTLFSIFFGINDVTNSWALGDDSLNYRVIQSYQNLVNTLYDAGARNFLFLNVPPIDRSPGTIEQGPIAQAAEAAYIGTFNFRLGALVYNLSQRYSDTISFLFDTNLLFTRVLDDSGQFIETEQLKNTTEYCTAYENSTPTMTYFDPVCFVPVNEYFWLNNLHPTYPVHNFIGSQIVQLLGTMN